MTAVGIAELPKVMAWCLALTLLLEVFAAAALGLRKRDLLFVVLVNVITNPVLVSATTLICWFYGMRAYYVSLAVFEIAAFFTEALLYKYALKPKLNPFLLSLILNVFSAMIGNVINGIFF